MIFARRMYVGIAVACLAWLAIKAYAQSTAPPQLAPGADFSNYGIAGAVILVTLAFLYFLTAERKDRKEERETNQALIEKIVKDHSEKVGSALKDLTREIENCPKR